MTADPSIGFNSQAFQQQAFQQPASRLSDSLKSIRRFIAKCVVGRKMRGLSRNAWLVAKADGNPSRRMFHPRHLPPHKLLVKITSELSHWVCEMQSLTSVFPTIMVACVMPSTPRQAEAACPKFFQHDTQRNLIANASSNLHRRHSSSGFYQC